MSLEGIKKNLGVLGVVDMRQILLQCLKILFFKKKNNNGLMENHGLGTHNDEMSADISTGNTPNTPQFIQSICPNRLIIWDISEKKP